MGESEAARDKMLLELEQECLEVYRRKVDAANRSRAQLRQSIADSEAELAAICSAMGELPVHIRQVKILANAFKAYSSLLYLKLDQVFKLLSFIANSPNDESKPLLFLKNCMLFLPLTVEALGLRSS